MWLNITKWLEIIMPYCRVMLDSSKDPLITILKAISVQCDKKYLFPICHPVSRVYCPQILKWLGEA